MINSDACVKKYGLPDLLNKAGFLSIWVLPKDLVKGCIPKRIYCNTDLVEPLTNAIKNLISRGCIEELHTWDGCFNIRAIRGGVNWSLHSWGIAIDVNASQNQLGQVPQLSDRFVQCFKDAGFDWGGDFSRKDGMHFQLSKI